MHQTHLAIACTLGVPLAANLQKRIQDTGRECIQTLSLLQNKIGMSAAPWLRRYLTGSMVAGAVTGVAVTMVENDMRWKEHGKTAEAYRVAPHIFDTDYKDYKGFVAPTDPSNKFMGKPWVESAFGYAINVPIFASIGPMMPVWAIPLLLRGADDILRHKQYLRFMDDTIANANQPSVQ